MSAIAGLLRTDRHAVEVEPAERMAAVLGRPGDDDSYRSPDGRAALAVAGAPLLANETHDIWLVLDGEILNYRPLRHTLELLGHRFRGTSPAEVALHAYEQWELDFPAHLHGAFALALWDDRRDRLVLARDRLGCKPLFVARHRGRLGFASGIGAVLAGLDLPRRLDPTALAHYLTLGSVPAPATLVAGVSALAAGEVLVVGRDGGPRRHRWRDLLPGGTPPLRGLPAERHAGNLRTLLECAVADRLEGARGVGLWLTPEPASGAIAAIVTRLTGASPPSVMVGAAGEDSPAIAAMRGLAAAARLDPAELRLSAADVAAAVPAMVGAMVAPVAAPELVPAWFATAALAHSRVGAVLAHGGAGQVLLDAPAYGALRPRGWGRLRRWLTAPARALPAPLFTNAATGLVTLELPAAPPALPTLPAWLGNDALAVAGVDDLTLRVVDGAAPAMAAIAGAHAVSMRLPFLDAALVDYALGVPSRVRANPRLLGDLVPAAVTAGRPPPALPLASWLAGPLGELVIERAARWPVLERAAVAALVEVHRADPIHATRLWAVLVLAEWCLGLGLDQVAPADSSVELVYSRS
ncbi:MAG: asparagine synthetase B family protein [Bacteroidota bacterium]